MTIGHIIATVLIGIIAAAARAAQGSWFFPGPIFALYWFVQALLSLVDEQFRTSPETLYWIAGTCLVLAIANYLGGGRVEPVRSGHERRVQIEHQFPLVVVGTIGSALFLILSESRGVRLSVEAAPAWIQILLMFNYFTTFVAGVSAASASRAKTVLFLLPLLPPLALSILTTGRLAFLLPLLYWIGGFISVRIVERGGRLKAFKPKLLLGVLAGAVLAALFVNIIHDFRRVSVIGSSASDRVQAFERVLTNGVSHKESDDARRTILGQIYSFDYYLTRQLASPEPPRWGTVMFRGPLIALGYDVPRLPFESFEMTPGYLWNTYTILRPPITDFGLLGSLGFWAAVGVVQGFAYRRARRGRLYWLIVIAWFYVELPLIGGLFFSYNIINLAHVIAAVYLAIAGRWVTDGRRIRPTTGRRHRRSSGELVATAAYGWGIR